MGDSLYSIYQIDMEPSKGVNDFLQHWTFPYGKLTLRTVNDVLVDPNPFLIWSIHTLLQKKKSMDQPERQ